LLLGYEHGFVQSDPCKRNAAWCRGQMTKDMVACMYCKAFAQTRKQL